jgi:hypothetical protein
MEENMTTEKTIINFSELKKGDVIRSNQLGELCEGVLMESPKQGKGLKSTILIDAKGSELGLFDEMGSIYSYQIKLVKRNGEWFDVGHSVKVKSKISLDAILDGAFITN